jgi:hypothetical protein
MRFVLGERLLLALRQRRKHPAAATAQTAALDAREAPVSLTEHLRTLSDPARSAASFVRQMNQLQREVEEEHDAFLLDPGMGPMIYLTGDGRVLVDGRTWDGTALREANDDEAIAGLVTGAEKTGVSELLELLPGRPEDGQSCPKCGGGRRAEPVPGCGFRVVCVLCRGRGWVAQGTPDESAKT